MRWSEIQFRPPDKILRQFVGLWVLTFGALAAWHWLVLGRPTAGIALAVLALTVGPLGLIRPQLIRQIYVAWMVLAFPIGWTISYLMLALIFYGLFTPIALVFRLIGRDALHHRTRPQQATYYLPKVVPDDPVSYLRQY